MSICTHLMARGTRLLMPVLIKVAEASNDLEGLPAMAFKAGAMICFAAM